MCFVCIFVIGECIFINNLACLGSQQWRCLLCASLFRIVCSILASRCEGVIAGMTRFTNKHHIARAVLEGKKMRSNILYWNVGYQIINYHASSCVYILTIDKHPLKYFMPSKTNLVAIAYQSHDVFKAMAEDSGISLKTLKVDGGMVQNQLLMQV